MSDEPLIEMKRPEKLAPTPLRRLVVSESIYHNDGIGEETSTGQPWSMQLKTDEQPYQRRMKVDDSTPLDHGWLKSASMVHLANKGKHTLTVLNNGEVISRIPPGCSSRLMVDGMSLDLLRLEGNTYVIVTVFPN